MLVVEGRLKGLRASGLLILKDLEENGFVEVQGGAFKIDFDDVWTLEETVRQSIGLEVLNGLELQVAIRGALGKPGASFDMRMTSPLGNHTARALDGGKLSWAEDVYLLPKGVGRAIGVIQAAGQAPSPESQYRILSEIRGLEGVKLPDAFAEGVEVIEGWGLDVEEDEGGFRVGYGEGRNSKSEPVDIDQLGDRIEESNIAAVPVQQMHSAYTLPDGRRVYLGGGAKPAAHDMMQRRKRIYSRRELAAALHSDPTLGLDLDTVSLDGFSDRVERLGVFVTEPQLHVTGSGTHWEPEVVMATEAAQPIRFLVREEEDFKELERAVFEQEEAGDGLVEFKGVFIPLEHALELLSLLRQRFEGGEQVPQGTLIPIVREEPAGPDSAEWHESLGQLHFSPPANLKSEFSLRTHQQQGLAWLQELAWNCKSRGALLADDMGLGKTLQVWSFLETWVCEERAKDGPMLVVAPISLLENWMAEYARFFNGCLRVRIVSTRDLEMLDWSGLGVGDVVLVNYEGMVRAAVPMAQVDWSVVAFDEAQKIKNPATLVSHVAKSLKATFRIAMTGTPVENSLLDFWNIMDFLCPGLLGSKREFKRGYHVDGTMDEKLAAAARLRSKVGWHMLRRLKADVAADLPAKTEYPHGWTSEQGLHKWSSEMTDLQHRVYSGIQQHLEDVRRTGSERYLTALLRAIEGWRLTVDHPLLTEKIEDVLERESVPALIEQSAKLTNTVRILDDIRSEGEKALVFTNFKMTQRMLRRVFEERYGIDVSIINGDTPARAASRARESRQQVVERFNTGDGFSILVLSPIAAGFGLNIQGANHVIHFTRHWNPAKEAQATDRAYRIGQTLPVSVYYPMSLSTRLTTFDARLHELLLSKKALADESLIPSEEVKLADFNT